MKNNIIGRKMINLKSNINDYINDKVKDPNSVVSSASVENLTMPVKPNKLKVDDEGQVMMYDKEPKKISFGMNFYNKKSAP